MKTKQSKDYSINKNETYANIIKSIGIANILIPIIITIMFLMITAIFKINMAATNSIMILSIFYGLWLLSYICFGIWITIIIHRNNWFIKQLEDKKYVYWLFSLIFLIIPIGIIGAIIWVIWGNKAMKITEEYRKFGDPKNKEENIKYFEELNKDLEEELEQELTN